MLRSEVYKFVTSCTEHTHCFLPLFIKSLIFKRGVLLTKIGSLSLL